MRSCLGSLERFLAVTHDGWVSVIFLHLRSLWVSRHGANFLHIRLRDETADLDAGGRNLFATQTAHHIPHPGRGAEGEQVTPGGLVNTAFGNFVHDQPSPIATGDKKIIWVAPARFHRRGVTSI